MSPPQSASRAVQVRTVSGQAVRPYLPALAALRTEVFRDWPYLYEGTAASEERYLSRYAAIEGVAVVLALDGETCVGASTCHPLAHEKPNMLAPFQASGWPIADTCYFGESVLLPRYRGQGIGVKFFEGREAHARALGLDLCAFCGVVRPAVHPLKPPSYVPLDTFWRNRGYTPRPDLVCTMHWRDVDAALETTKNLSFWVRSLSGRELP